MRLIEKYNNWSSIYEKYYISRGDPETMGKNIPVEYVSFNGNSSISATVGDGTIQLALDLQLSYSLFLLATVENSGEKLTKYQNQIYDSLKTLVRLEDQAYKICFQQYPLYKTQILNGKQKGFFLRDDFDNDASILNTSKIIGSYNRCVTITEEEDPCHSAFVSQDQIWNLLPILNKISKDTRLEQSIRDLAKEKASDMLKWVIDNHHTIYNPYYSAMYHFWTYLPNMNADELLPWNRVKDRANNFKPKIKVKRGANNWYFGYGFRKSYENISSNKLPFCKNLIYGMWYKPFIFLADRIYYPLLKKWVKVKETSYYSLAVASEGKAWYLGNYKKRLISRFNSSLNNSTGKEDLFMPELSFLIDKDKDIDFDKLYNWLNSYPDFSSQNVDVHSPVIFMILFNYYRYYSYL